MKQYTISYIVEVHVTPRPVEAENVVEANKLLSKEIPFEFRKGDIAGFEVGHVDVKDLP